MKQNTIQLDRPRAPRAALVFTAIIWHHEQMNTRSDHPKQSRAHQRITSAVVGPSRDQNGNPTCARRRTTVVAGFACLVLVSVLALCPSPAVAQCPQGWNIGERWGLKQNNQDEPNALNLAVQKADANRVVGLASYGSPEVKGNVQGYVAEDAVHLEISWSNGLTGIYDGKIATNGIIRGTGYEKKTPKTKVGWFSTRAMICRRAPLPPPNPVSKPPPVKTAPPAAPPAVPPSQPQQSTGAPTITASPRTVSIPDGATSGTTTLTWDAGKDHPYAEVWVSVDGGDETKIVEQGKGSRQVNVKPGQTYLYILTDSGEQLSTVAVTTK